MYKPKGPIGISIEVAISLLLIFGIIAWCLQIIAPFITFLMWGAVIAISLHKPFCKMRGRMGSKLAAATFTIVGLGLVLIPAWLFTDSTIETVYAFSERVESGTFDVPPPNDSVKEWPIVGNKIWTAWNAAATNFAKFLSTYSEQLKDISGALLSKVTGLGATILLFVLSILIAAVMLSNDETIKAGMIRIFTRLIGPDKAQETLRLTSATIRSVTMGVLGVAFIQSVLGGLGMVLADVPAAGVWAIVILVLAIAQLPPLIVLVPAIIYVFSVESTVVAVIFMIWSILVSLSDAVLKPLLLGRGVEIPMVVILLGAIGGMLMSGILGLFVGAVVLALGYKLTMVWIEMGEASEPETNPATDETAS